MYILYNLLNSCIPVLIQGSGFCIWDHHFQTGSAKEIPNFPAR